MPKELSANRIGQCVTGCIAETMISIQELCIRVCVLNSQQDQHQQPQTTIQSCSGWHSLPSLYGCYSTDMQEEKLEKAAIQCRKQTSFYCYCLRFTFSLLIAEEPLFSYSPMFHRALRFSPFSDSQKGLDNSNLPPNYTLFKISTIKMTEMLLGP